MGGKESRLYSILQVVTRFVFWPDPAVGIVITSTHGGSGICLLDGWLVSSQKVGANLGVRP
jgi:hypothetical protein